MSAYAGADWRLRMPLHWTFGSTPTTSGGKQTQAERRRLRLLPTRVALAWPIRDEKPLTCAELEADPTLWDDALQEWLQITGRGIDNASYRTSRGATIMHKDSEHAPDESRNADQHTHIVTANGQPKERE